MQGVIFQAYRKEKLTLFELSFEYWDHFSERHTTVGILGWTPLFFYCSRTLNWARQNKQAPCTLSLISCSAKVKKFWKARDKSNARNGPYRTRADGMGLTDCFCMGKTKLFHFASNIASWMLWGFRVPTWFCPWTNVLTCLVTQRYVLYYKQIAGVSHGELAYEDWW